MIRRPAHRLALLAVLLTVGLVLTACGDGGDGGDGTAQGLEGADLTVASKEFTEQVILGKMMVLALEDAGASVKDQTSLAGTSVVRDALETGEVDMYFEYTGTAWADIFGEEEIIDDPDELLEKVRQRDEEENNITWGERADFENTYAFAQNQQIADELGVETLSDLAELSKNKPDEATLCIAEEFATREDGFPGMAEHYGMEIPDDNITLLSEGVIYSQIDQAPDSDCNFGMVFTTDGRIGALDLQVLEDDESFFPEYNPALAIRQDVADEHSEALEIGNEIMNSLDFKTMRNLNLRVDQEGELPEDVAEEHLREEGIIG